MTRPIRTPMHLLAFICAAGALAFSGCGGEDEAAPETVAPQAVETFFTGIANEDFEAACATLASELQAALGGGSCAAGLGAVASGLEPAYTITNVRISGTKGAVDVELTDESGEVREDTVELLQENGDWLISSFGE